MDNPRSRTILVVDDNPANLQLVSRYLKEFGFEMLVARDGNSALEKAQYGQPDLILLDVLMPGISGFETCRRLKADASLQDIPVIFMTSLAETQDKIKGFQVGAVDYITKPFQYEEVLARITTHLQLRELTEFLEVKVRERTEELSTANRQLHNVNEQLTREIAERKRVETSLRASEERFRALYEDNPSMYFTLDKEGIVLSVNRFGSEQLGYKDQELIGQSVLRVFYPDDREAVRQQLEACLQYPGQVVRWEYRKVRKDGSMLWVREGARAVQGADGSLRILVVCEDITQRKVMEEEKEALQAQVIHAQKMEAMGRLAGGIAHDFNNLLTVIQLNAQLMKRKLLEQDPLWGHVHEIQETGNRATKLVRQLLSFSRREIVEPRFLNLNGVVEGMESMLRRIIGENIDLKVELATDLWSVRGASSQMEQVIVNLAVNARDAMPAGGTLRMETSNVVLDEAYAALHVEAQPGPHVLLMISDTGVGMTDEVKDRIFEPFFTTKRGGRGTGLGLATVFGIVKQSDGHIRVYSKVGQGTTFKIYLPQTKQAEA